MATIVLGDDQRMRLARQENPFQYVQRKSIMEGGDKLTPNDVVTIASTLYGGGNIAARMFGSTPNTPPTGNGALPTPAGPSGAFGLVAPEMPQQPPSLPPPAGPSGMKESPFSPSLGLSFGAQKQMGSPSLGLQQQSQTPFLSPLQMMPDLNAYPGVQAQSPVDQYRKTLDFQTPNTVPSPQNFMPPPQDVSFPAMRDVPPSQMMAGGPAAAQAPQAPPPFSGAGSSSASTTDAKVLQLPVAVAQRRGVGSVTPDRALQGAGMAMANATLVNAAQAAPQPNYDYIGQQQPQQPTVPQQAPQLSPDEQYRQQVAQYQQELERRAMSAIQIRPNASYPELLAARDRAIYGTPEDRAAYERAVMSAPLTDVPPQGIDDLLSGAHITRARAQLLGGLGAGAFQAGQAMQKMDLERQKAGLQQRAENRKQRQGDTRNDISMRRLMFDADTQKYANWLNTRKDDRAALESALRMLKGATELGYIPAEKVAEIKQKRAMTEQALSNAQLAETRARAVPFKVAPQGTRVSVTTESNRKPFIDERNRAYEARDAIARAVAVRNEGAVNWTDFLSNMGVKDAQRFAGNQQAAKQEARRVLQSKVDELAQRIKSARAIQPPSLAGMTLPSISENANMKQLRDTFTELGIVVTPDVAAIIGLPQQSGME